MAAKRFAERGVPVLDADAMGHAAIAPGGAAEQPVIDAFGNSITTDGKISRDKLAALVFDDAEALTRLNAIVHPAVFAQIGARLRTLGEEGHSAVLVEAALWAENGKREDWQDGLILVLCNEKERLRRLIHDRGMTQELARQRMARQRAPEKKIPLAHWLVENEGTKEELFDQVDAIVEQINYAR